MKQPVCCEYTAAFHFHAVLLGMLSPTLIRDEVREMGQPCEKRLLTTTRVMKPFHGKEFPLHGALCAWPSKVLVEGIYGSSRTAYHPAFFS